jgi:hypothetical protein
MNQQFRWWPSVVAIAGLLLGPSWLFAARDDEEVTTEGPEVNQWAAMNADVDAWIFQGNGNAQKGREQIQTRLKLRLAELERVCGLKEAQKQKLMLAARGDTQRFFEQVDDLRERFAVVKHDQNAWNQFWPEIMPLQKKLSGGLFDERSFFVKTLRKTLDSQQWNKYQQLAAERKRFHYQAIIEAAMASLDNNLALRNEQHQALARLLTDETQPPPTFGDYDFYLVMYRLCKLPKDKVRPVLDKRQMKLFEQQCQQYLGMKQFLVQNGYLDEEDAGHDAPVFDVEVEFP